MSETVECRPATPADAEIAMRLYELRRETEMRKARNFVNAEFWPRSYEEFATIALALGDPRNAYLRQATSYWEMAASLVVRGVLHPGVFLDWCGEAFFTYVKFKPLLPEIRRNFGATAFANIEMLAARYTEMAERVRMLEQRIPERYPQPKRD